MRHLAVPVLEDPSVAPAPAAALPLDDERAFRSEEVGRLPAHVTALHRAADGSLWAGTFDAGLFRAPPEGAFAEVAGLEGPAKFVNAIVEHDGALWVGTARGLWRFAPRGRPLGRAMGGAVEALVVAPGALVAGTARGLYAVGTTGPSRPLGGREGAGLRVSALAETDGVLWAGTPAGLYAVSGGGARFVPLVFGEEAAGSNWVTALAAFDRGVLAATDDGGHALVALPDVVRAVHFADAPANSTNPGAAARLGEDVFLGTPGGILRVRASPEGRPATALLAPLRGTHIAALAAAGAALYAGTDDGRVYRVARP